MTQQGGWKATLWPVARTALAVSLIAWVLSNAGIERIGTAIREAKLLPVALGFVAVFALSVCKVWNWRQLLAALGVGGRRFFRRLFACYFSGGLLGTVVPSTAGTDAIRAMLARQAFGGGVSRHVAAVVVFNGMSWLASCSLGLCAILILVLSGDIPRIAYVATPLFLAVTTGAVSVYALLKYRRGWWLGILSLTPRSLFRIRRPLRRFADQLLVFERAHAHFAPTFFVAIGAQTFYAAAIALCGFAVGVELPWPYWFVYGPLAALAALIPASVSGFGADQVALIYIMGLADVSPAHAFVVSVLLALINLTMNLVVGGLTFTMGSAGIKASDVPIQGVNSGGT